MSTDAGMKPLTGKLTISRSQGRDNSTPVHIQVEDEISGCRLLEINMTLKDFADCLLGLGYVPMQMEVNLSGVIGMKSEHKTELVEFNCYGKREDTAKQDAALKPFEVDGWHARRDDLTNGHRSNGKGMQSVTFFRHVDPVTGKPFIDKENS